jgi:AraC-like DNA-binding protein
MEKGTLQRQEKWRDLARKQQGNSFRIIMARQEIITLDNGEQIRLSEREKLFCEYYLADANRNATEAAKMCGYSKENAFVQASRMLSKVKVKAYLDYKTKPILDELAVKQNDLMMEWVNLAFSTPNVTVTKDSDIPIGFEVTHNFKTLTIEGMDVDSHEKQVAYKLSHKVNALIRLSEMTGLFKKDSSPGMDQPQQINIFNQINSYLKEK